MSDCGTDIEKVFEASERRSSSREKQIPINFSCLDPLSTFCTKSSLEDGAGWRSPNPLVNSAQMAKSY